MDAETMIANERSTRELDTRDTDEWVSGFINAAINVDIWQHLEPAAAALFTAGGQLLEAPLHSTQARIGHALMLEALATSPAALAQVAQDLRARLLDTAPGLEMLKR